MNQYLLVVALLALSSKITAHSLNENENECTPGTTFNSPNGQKICICPSDGKASGIHCTVKPASCTPGKPTKVGCNSCGCNEDGTIGICTQHTCPIPVKCTAGTMFAANDKCNMCICPKSGNQQEACCTNENCYEDSCRPGEKFVGDNGKMCICPYSGSRTLATCSTVPSKPQVCTPGEKYSPDGCKDCMCDSFGQESGCTKVFCEKGRCTPEKKFKRGCNTCTCPDDGVLSKAVCTEFDCSPKPSLRPTQ